MIGQMRIGLAGVAVGLLSLVVLGSAHGDLQNVRIGGSIEAYGAYYSDIYSRGGSERPWPGSLLPKRPIGPGGTITFLNANGDSHAFEFFEHRVRLSVEADFTDGVSGFIELISQEEWGTDFPSDYITGVDGRRGADVGMHQVYIQTRDTWGLPVQLRIGRQELAFGNEWLVSPNLDPDPFVATSFDGIRLTYEADAFTVDAFATLLSEDGFAEEDGNVSFYGLYGSYRGLQDMEIDAYYLFLRDAREIHDTQFVAAVEWVEELFGLDQYGPTTLHTVGLRVAGLRGGWDWYGEAAIQWGDADAIGSLFKPLGTYGDTDARFSNWGANGEVGYTFDTQYSPRVYLAGAYYGADDNRDISFVEWINPFYRPEASVAFNRLFSGTRHTHFIDGSAFSNFWFVRGGAEAAVTENLTVGVDVLYHRVVEAFDAPYHVHLVGFKVPVAPSYSFWTKEGSKDLGTEALLTASYQYSEDLTFEVGYAHWFTGKAIDDGVFADTNGLLFLGGSGNEDADSVYFMTTLAF